MRLNVLSIASLLVVSGLAACSFESNHSGFQQTSDVNGNKEKPGSFGGSPDGGGGGAACAPNPANAEIPGNNCDDDGDGKVDNAPTCDGSLAPSGSAEEFAQALGVCAKASTKGYGLVSATFTRGYQVTTAPSADQHGILPKFGNVIRPREGARLGVLSTGYAQEFDGPGSAPFTQSQDWSRNGAVPPGFPKPAEGCQQATETNDVVNVKLELKAPPNASGFKFDFNFFSAEWPQYVCSRYNDGFIAYLTAKGFNGGKADNISFDAKKNPVSVNNGFFDRCTPDTVLGCMSGANVTLPRSTCPGGPGELGGTGFGITGPGCGGAQATTGGATGWLTSQAPVQPGETFTLELMIWDTGDQALDSSVLLDNFQWVAGAVTTQTERPR